MTLLAGTLTAGGIAAAFTATLIGRDSTALYVVCAAFAAAGLLLMLLQLARSRHSPAAPWYALAPMSIVAALLGVAASGAGCGAACIAWGAPAAAAALAAPDIRDWLGRRRTLKRL